MEFELAFQHVGIGAAGAGALELLKLYELRGKMNLVKYQKQMRSPVFWAIVVGMLLASGFIAWAFHEGATDVSAWSVVITGVAARSVIHGALAARAANGAVTMGEKPVGDELSWRDAFT